ncbi:MAG: hypothetical protein ABIH11_05570 [Candidatus Altiarchaeota archaeon]
MRDRGLLFSIMSLMLVLSVFTLAAYYSTIHVGEEIQSEKMNNIFSDVQTDIEQVLAMNAEVVHDGGRTMVRMNDRMPLEDGVSTLNAYEDHLEGYYAGKINSDIRFFRGSEPEMSIEPVGMVYGYNTYNKQELRVYNETGEARVYAYELYFRVDGNFVNAQDETLSGSRRVKINGTFANTGYEEMFTVSPTESSTVTLNFTTGKVRIHLGRNTIKGVERDNSIRITMLGDIGGEIGANIVFDDMADVGVKTNMSLEVSGPITRRDNVWLTPPV